MSVSSESSLVPADGNDETTSYLNTEEPTEFEADSADVMMSSIWKV